MSSAELAASVRERLVRDGAPVSRASVASAVRAASALSGDAGMLRRLDQVESELVGIGVLQPLADDPAVTDILVNGPDQVWVERAGRLERTPVVFTDAAAVRRLAQRLAAGAGRRLDDAQPWVDVRLPDGIRLHAVLAPIAADGPVLSLRLPRRSAFTLDDLVAAGMFPAYVGRLLVQLVLRRCSFLVTGGTGSGKTTLLSTLLGLCPAAERVVLVEDLNELRPALGHVVRLEARPANLEGAGRVGLADLVRQALRMRPDRLVVGEVRGAEVVDLLAALNTGHEGGCGTVHAGSARALPARVEALATAAGLGRSAAHSQLAAAVDVVVHLDRGAAGVRRLACLGVLRQGPDGLASVLEAVVLCRDGSYQPRDGWDQLSLLLGLAVSPSELG
ncbi:MAG: pilus assembly protein CpaF [Frankiales bacterium]|nr:pilus assembly protein CpaF [Frankiales bacterium]